MAAVNLEDYKVGGLCYANKTMKPLLADILNVFFLLLYAVELGLYLRIVLVLRKRDRQFQNTKDTATNASNSGTPVSGKVGIVVGTILACHLPNMSYL